MDSPSRGLYSRESNVGRIMSAPLCAQKRFTEARIWSADLVHLKGLGFWLCRSMKAWISALSFLTEVLTPRRSRFSASSANQRSTAGKPRLDPRRLVGGIVNHDDMVSSPFGT